MVKLSFSERMYELACKQVKIVEEMELQPDDWSKVKVDTLIHVRHNSNDKWKKCYFSKYSAKDDTVYIFSGGKTSLTASNASCDCAIYSYMKLIEENLN